jgi:hypothetical protein
MLTLYIDDEVIGLIDNIGAKLSTGRTEEIQRRKNRRGISRGDVVEECIRYIWRKQPSDLLVGKQY